ncbi:MAG: hypothetical protein AB7J32_00955 [Pseudonocardia sp.]
MTATLDDLLGRRLRLAEALAAAGQPGVDDARVRFLYEALQDALDVLEAIAGNDDLWGRMRAVAGELRPGGLPALTALVDHRLAPLLTAFGYEGPPPVHELVDTTAELLGYAVAAVGDPVRAQYDVDIARSAVARFVARARVQVDGRAAPPDRRLLCSVGRRVRRMSERLVPPVAGAGAAALVVGAFGGVEGGVLAGAAYKSVEELVKQLVELSAAYVVGWGEEVRTAIPVPTLPPAALRITELELLTEAFGAGVARWSAQRTAPRPGPGDLPPAGLTPPAGLWQELDEIEVALEGFATARGIDGPDTDRSGRDAGERAPGAAVALRADVAAVRDVLRELRSLGRPGAAVPPPRPASPSPVPAPLPAPFGGPGSPESVDRAVARLVVLVRGLRRHLDAIG